MPRIKKAGPWNPQKATAYVGKGVLKYGDTIPAIRGSFTPVPNGPLIKKKGEFKGSTLKNGGMKKIKKAQDGEKLKRSRTYIMNAMSPGSPRIIKADYSVDTTGFAAGKKKFPATVTRTDVKRPSRTSTTQETIRRPRVKQMIKKQRNGGKLKPRASNVSKKLGSAKKSIGNRKFTTKKKK